MSKTIAVPISLINLQDDGFHLLVKIKVFDKTAKWAVVDTGASRSVFDKQYILDNIPELFSAEETQATTLFTTSSTLQGLVPSIKIGSLKIRNYETVALDLETVNEAYAQMGHPPITAILGSDLLLKYQTVIDYKKLKMYFRVNKKANQ